LGDAQARDRQMGRGREQLIVEIRKAHRGERMRVRCLGVITVVVAALALHAAARAQSYPDRPVRMVIALPAGGTIDTLGRILAQKLTEAWGQNVVIQNRPGAGGNLGGPAAAKAAPAGSPRHFGAEPLAVHVAL